MADRSVLRWGGLAAMAGAVVAFVFNILHPRVGEPDNTEKFLTEIADSSIWVFDHYMLAWALALALIGFLAIGRSFADGPGASWGRIAAGSAIAGITVALATVLVDGPAVKDVADAWADGPNAETLATATAVLHVGEALFTGIMGSIFGITPVLFGVAVLNGRGEYLAWLAWLAIGSGGLGLFTGSVQYLTGISNATANILFPIGSLAATVFLFVAGWTLWKRTSEAPAAMAAPAGTPAV
jgi:hypothetical protein